MDDILAASQKISALTAKILAVCPIDGLGFGDNPADKSHWRIDFKQEATAEQRAAAAAITDAFSFDAPQIPASVKTWQAKAALANAGKLEAANSVVAASNSQPLIIAWEYAADLSRTSAGLNAMASALGMSNAEVDALFLAADAIQV